MIRAAFGLVLTRDDLGEVDYEAVVDTAMCALVDISNDPTSGISDPTVSLDLGVKELAVEFVVEGETEERVSDLGISTWRTVIHTLGGATPQAQWDAATRPFRTLRQTQELIGA